MGYSTDTEQARKLAESVHRTAVDKAGEPYIHHPERVAGRLDAPEEKVVGWLHDVVEDSAVTVDQIGNLFGPETAAAVDAVTHRPLETWADYLARVRKNPVARAVKISDLIDNSNMSRLPKVTRSDVERTEKYLRALRFLMDLD